MVQPATVSAVAGAHHGAICAKRARNDCSITADRDTPIGPAI
jgi:hypothetical protein